MDVNQQSIGLPEGCGGPVAGAGKYPESAVARSRWIIESRDQRSRVQLDPRRPVDFWVEEERQADGTVEAGITILIVNRECAWRCVMCDLWKHTTERAVGPGDVPAQIEFALASIGSGARGWIKLYNAGSFFDAGAIPAADHPEIARLCRGFSRVIVESHPRLVGGSVWRFRDLIEGRLEVAMGLETANEEVLGRLNKRFGLSDYDVAAGALGRMDCGLRTFLLVQPPFMKSAEAEEWACRSIDHAQGCGSDPVVVIPTRIGNGAMERLMATGDFELPGLAMLERVVSYGVGKRQGRVFSDLWDLERWVAVTGDGEGIRERLQRMNRHQLEAVLP